MTRILSGVVIVLLLGMWLLALRLEVNATEAGRLTLELGRAEQRVVEAEAETKREVQRLELLAASIDQLRGELKGNQEQLDRRLKALAGIKRTEGDSDESWKCLDSPVARDFDQWLRDDANGGGDRAGVSVPAGAVPGTVPGR